MAFNIKWSDEAIKSYEQVIVFIARKWTNNEAANFILEVESVVKAVSNQPYLFPASNFNQIRKAVVSKQISLYYLVHEEEIYLIHFGIIGKIQNQTHFKLSRIFASKSKYIV